MRLAFGLAAPIAAATLVGGCATLPEMPPDHMLPVREIVLHAVCELRIALHSVQRTHHSFQADQWAISITLTPKIDTEVSLRAGLTGKNTSATVPFFTTWAVGSAPGAEYDMKGHKDGTVKYSIHSRQLLDDKRYPLTCDTTTPTYHALARVLGIQDWLERASSAAEGDISKLTKLDSPTYNSQIVIQWDGSGNFTYNFPFGTNFAGLFASYKLDESLAIAFTPDPIKKEIHVRTLPSGTGYSSVGTGIARLISPQAQNRLDLLSLEQTIRNLDTSNPIRRR